MDREGTAQMELTLRGSRTNILVLFLHTCIIPAFGCTPTLKINWLAGFYCVLFSA